MCLHCFWKSSRAHGKSSGCRLYRVSFSLSLFWLLLPLATCSSLSRKEVRSRLSRHLHSRAHGVSFQRFTFSLSLHSHTQRHTLLVPLSASLSGSLSLLERRGVETAAHQLYKSISKHRRRKKSFHQEIRITLVQYESGGIIQSKFVQFSSILLLTLPHSHIPYYYYMTCADQTYFVFVHTPLQTVQCSRKKKRIFYFLSSSSSSSLSSSHVTIVIVCV